MTNRAALAVALAIPGLSAEVRSWLDSKRIDTVGELFAMTSDEKQWPCMNCIGEDKNKIDEYLVANYDELNELAAGPSDLIPETIEYVDGKKPFNPIKASELEPVKKIEKPAEPKKETAKPYGSETTDHESLEARAEALQEQVDLTNRLEAEYKDLKEKSADKKKSYEEALKLQRRMSGELFSEHKPQREIDFDKPKTPAAEPESKTDGIPLSAICEDKTDLKKLAAVQLTTIAGLLAWRRVTPDGKIKGIKAGRLSELVLAAEKYGRPAPVADKMALRIAAGTDSEPRVRSMRIRTVREVIGAPDVAIGTEFDVEVWRAGLPLVNFEQGGAVQLAAGDFEEVPVETKAS